MFVGSLMSFWWFAMICVLYMCVWSYSIMMYDVVFSDVCFCDLFDLCMFCLLYMCRVVFDSLRFVMTFPLFLFVWFRMYPCSFSKSFQVRSKTKLLISLNAIRVKQNHINWMKQYMVFCVFHQKLMNMEYKDLSSYWFVCFSDDQET